MYLEICSILIVIISSWNIGLFHYNFKQSIICVHVILLVYLSDEVMLFTKYK